MKLAARPWRYPIPKVKDRLPSNHQFSGVFNRRGVSYRLPTPEAGESSPFPSLPPFAGLSQVRCSERFGVQITHQLRTSGVDGD